MDTKLSLSILLVLAISASYVVAESITTAQQEYWLGETVQAEVVMNNFDLAKLSFTDNKSGKIPVGFLMMDADGKQLVYFNMPTSINAGEYHLIAKDQRAINGVLQEFNISTKISVSGNLGVSIDPPRTVLDPTRSELKISLINNADSAVAADISASNPSFKPARNPLQLGPKETKNAFISYNYSEISSDQTIYMSYSNRTHAIKVVLPESEQKETKTAPETPSAPEYVEQLKFDAQKTVEKQASTYTGFSDSLTLRSTVRKDLHNLKFALTGSIKDISELKIASADTIPAEGTIDQYIWINKGKKAKAGTYEGDLMASTDEGYSDSLHFKITLAEPKTIEENATAKPSVTLFNKSSLSLLINETKAENKPDVQKNVTIAMLLLVIVLFIAFLIGRKLRNKTQKKGLEEYVHSLKKGHK